MSKKKNRPPITDLRLAPPIRLTVCTKKKHVKFIEKFYGIDLSNTPPHARAWASLIENEKSGDTIGIICIDRPAETRVQNDALIVHEAVHVAQYYFADIGEDNPGREIQAYTVQEIAQAAMTLYYGEGKE